MELSSWGFYSFEQLVISGTAKSNKHTTLQNRREMTVLFWSQHLFPPNIHEAGYVLLSLELLNLALIFNSHEGNRNKQLMTKTPVRTEHHTRNAELCI